MFDLNNCVCVGKMGPISTLYFLVISSSALFSSFIKSFFHVILIAVLRDIVTSHKALSHQHFHALGWRDIYSSGRTYYPKSSFTSLASMTGGNEWVGAVEHWHEF
jgi:hypothetical protein